LFVSILMIFLCYLVLTARKARERESKTIAFSSLMLEGQEAERLRIAAELHDSVLQDLRDKDCAARIREICCRILPPDFTRYKLRDSLITLCDSFVKRTGIECVVEITDDPGFELMSADQRLHLYRIAQEALNNAEKHSRAKKLILIARFSAEEPRRSLLFSVSDDGIGLSNGSETANSSKTADGLGMQTMRHRAMLLGGRIDFISEKGNGLMVCIEIPFNKAET